MDQREVMTVAAEFAAQKRILFGERVAFIVDPPDTQVGLIDLPEGTSLRKQSGTIVMVGVDVDTTKHRVRVGDRILFTKYEPQEIALSRLDGTEVSVSITHVFDLFVGWEDEELRQAYVDECVRLESPIVYMEYTPHIRED